MNTKDLEVISNKTAVSPDELRDIHPAEPPESNKSSSDKATFTTLQLSVLVIFACFGCGSTYVSRSFNAGFYLTFLVDRDLDTTKGTISMGIIVVTAAVSPYLLQLVPSFRNLSLALRLVILTTGNILCYFVLAAGDAMVTVDPGGTLMFGVVGVARALQGVCAGLMYVIMQGEIVDLYLADHKPLMVVISGSMHLALFTSSILANELYLAGGWLLIGFIIPVFDAVVLLLFPLANRIIRNSPSSGARTGNTDNVTSKPSPSLQEEQEITLPQKLAFCVPDVAVFVNNIAYFLLIFAIPARFESFTDHSLSTAALYTSLIPLVGFISCLVLGFLLSGKTNAIWVMIAGNFLFYAGGILAFGATTEFLAFPISFELGALLTGFGDACVINVAVMSKFYLYEKWNLDTTGLGERSSALYNLSFNFSTIVGMVLGGLALSRESEVPLIVTTASACVVNMLGLVTCLLV